MELKPGKRYIINSIFTKFVLAFFVVGFLPLIGLGYFFFGKLPQDLERDMIFNNSQILLYTSKNIELKISEYNQISQLIYNYKSGEDGSVTQLLEKGETQHLENFLRSTVYSDRYIESAFLMDSALKVSDYFSKNRFSFIDDFDFKTYPKSDQILENMKGLTILPTHKEDYFFRSENDVISFVRNYLDIHMLPDEEELVAVFCIEVNTGFLDSVLDSLFRNRDGSFYIIDNEGYPIFNSGDSERLDVVVETLSRRTSSIESEENGFVTNKDGYLFYRNIGATDWMLVYEIERGSVFRLINEYKRLGLAILVILIATLIILAVVFSRQLYRPIKNIMNQMKLVESGDLNSEVSVRTHDEIQQLAEAFNRMIRKLNQYIQNAFVAQIKQKEMELNAIRTQIRPHYLYNTLEIIRMSALEENADITQGMILALSEQLKYLIGFTSIEVKLQQELEMVRNYFQIIHIRYDQRLSLEIDVPDHLNTYSIPKLVIQPLVENAVVHGLKQKPGKGMVRISAQIENDILKIVVIDDGMGMPPERLGDVQIMLQDTDKSLSGTDGENIGLKNVQERIQLIYGRDYGLEVSSRDKAGTLATVRIPARIEGDS